MTSRQKKQKMNECPDISETRAHIFVAGHEILKAAEGVLNYCKSYVESTGNIKDHSNMLVLFSKGITIARELGNSMVKEFPSKGGAGKIFNYFCEIVENEIRQDKASKKTVKNKHPAKARKKRRS